MPESKTSERRITAIEKRVEALKLRKAGKTFPEIRDALKYRSVSSAYDAVMKGLRDTMQEPADELRKMEAERLDAMLVGLWDKAISGDTWSVDRVLGIMDRRARLFGLDKQGEEDLSKEAQRYLDLMDMARKDATDMSESSASEVSR